MSSLAHNVLAVRAENRPLMLEKGEYDTWQSRSFQYQVVDIPENEALGIPVETRMQTFKDLSPEEKIIKECDIRAANIILHGLPNDIYTLLNHKKIAHEIWYRVKELMEGTKLTKQEKESKLANEFDRFTSEKGETIHSYYIRFAKLMNDINIIGLDMTPLQVNTKFVNYLQPEWSRFVTGVKKANNLHQVSFDQLYAYLKQNEPDANEVCAMKDKFLDPLALIENTYNPLPSYSSYKSQYNPPMQPPKRPTSLDLGFVVPTFLPMDDPIASLNKPMMFLTTAISSRIVGDLNVIPPKEKMLLAQQQEAGIEIDAEQQYFLANGLEGFDSDCEELQLNATSILMTEKVDAYDSEVDDAPT
ncbi:hypothetical protein Tco_1410699, partial [Tanacetum coccineum]